MICEWCWADAFDRAQLNPDKSQTEHYHDLLEERKCDTVLLAQVEELAKRAAAAADDIAEHDDAV